MSDEMLEFLKRGEVRTMQKDIARFRKEEAGQEKEKIEGVPLMSPPATEPAPSLETPITVTLPSKPKTSHKVVTRIFAMLIVLFILAGGIAFGYWFFFVHGKAVPAIQKKAPSATQTPAPTITQTPTLAPQIPASAFPIQNTKTIELAPNATALSLLAQFLQQPQAAGFTRIVFEDSQTKAALNIKDFFSKMGTSLFPALAQNVQENFTLFSYLSPLSSRQTERRIGFVAQLINAKDALSQLRSWEPTLEKDTLYFFLNLGPKDKAYVAFFRPLIYKTMTIRCQTFSLQDLGICYSLVDNALVFSSSLESTKAVVDQLTTHK